MKSLSFVYCLEENIKSFRKSNQIKFSFQNYVSLLSSIKIFFACPGVCLFVSIKRKNGWTDLAKIFETTHRMLLDKNVEIKNIWKYTNINRKYTNISRKYTNIKRKYTNIKRKYTNMSRKYTNIKENSPI